MAGGRRITVPPRGTRPTTDRVREALFNILVARLDLTGMAVLDVYAGSGALGLEALSRGARSVTFIEADRGAAAVLERNVAALGLPGATVRRGSVPALLATPPPAPVDLVLADPPYDLSADEVDAVLAALVTHRWVDTGSVVMVERSAGGPPLRWSDQWEVWTPRIYGDTRLELAERL